MKAGALCGSCGNDLRENANFCDGCGARAAGPADAAEYKQVTVLFADVVRSMDMASALDLERLREVMTELVERSAAVVHRYGGGTVDFTGDGVMALFGAPVALEDHAFRACLAAQAIQEEASQLAAEVLRRDGMALQVRVGLNSGRVIAGGIGSGALGYGAIGRQVGFAQRMEAAAPPGGVTLSESTARLVENTVVLGEPEWVRVKGADEPVGARRLIAIGSRDARIRHAETALVGREWEMAALAAMLDRAVAGRGGLVTVVGPPGIGKTRTARETAALAAGRGVEVHWAFCESHASDIPFQALAQLLRGGIGVTGIDDDAARARLRATLPDADGQDVLLLDDLLGIADPEVPQPGIDSDARRRRLTALLNSVSLARTEPTLFVIEDAHWIDPVSDSMLADLLTVIARTPAMVLITARPEYKGAMSRVLGAQTIALAPLEDSDIETLLGRLLGSDLSIGALATMIAERADGNPFFAEEMVRELAQRGVLEGEHGDYVCRADVSELSVPATVQAAIEARIDRLSAPAKRTLNTASVIGARFDVELLAVLGIEAVVDELLDAELIDQVRFTPAAEYTFRHPLIRAVAYESQLKSDRAEVHRRLAAAIQEREPASVEENAALIAEHLEAAGELRTAYGWHMRAAGWSTDRDLDAARVSWERARRIADLLPDHPDQLAMRIAPRTMLCATDYQGRTLLESEGRFAELRQLCTTAGDKLSLATGMVGLATEFVYAGRPREGSRLASEQMALLESIGDPTPTMALAFVGFANWSDAGEFDELLRWSQTVVDLAAGDPTKGAAFGIGSPLAIALTWRGFGRYWLGRPGWRQDLRDAVAMARRSNHPTTIATVVTWTFGWAIHFGVLRADDSAVREIEEAVRTAQRASNDVALSVAEYGLGGVLLSRDTAADRRRGLNLMEQAHSIFLRKQVGLQMTPIIELWAARERARGGDHDAAITAIRNAEDELYRTGRLAYGVWATGILAETLLERGAEGDSAGVRKAIDRLTNLPAAEGWAMRDITVLRLQALSAKARGDSVIARDLVRRYRERAESLGFEGHIAMAAAM